MKNISIIIALCSFLSCTLNKDFFSVSSLSMAPNLAPDDIVRIDTSIKKFDYGDMIVCYQEGLEQIENIINVSRIVGLPSDNIKIKYDMCIIDGIENHYVMKQKTRLKSYDLSYDEYEEKFPNDRNVPILHSPSLETEDFITRTIKIPADHFFIMGDHRSNSYDSRNFGPISKDKILGKVIEIEKQDN